MSKRIQASPIPRDGAPAPRFRAQLRKALDLIAFDGKTQREAAKIAGMTETAFGRALNKPHVAAELERLKSMAYAEGAASRAIARAAAIRVGIELMHNAKSEAVRARMVEFFAGEPKAPGVVVQVNQPPQGYVYTRPQDRASGGDTVQDADIVEQKPDVAE